MNNNYKIFSFERETMKTFEKLFMPQVITGVPKGKIWNYYNFWKYSYTTFTSSDVEIK